MRKPSYMEGKMRNPKRVDMIWKKAQETVSKKCDTCEFNFGNVCAGHATRTDNGEDTYGMPMGEVKKMFPKGCTDYGISFDAFCAVANKMDQ